MVWFKSPKSQLSKTFCRLKISWILSYEQRCVTQFSASFDTFDIHSITALIGYIELLSTPLTYPFISVSLYLFLCIYFVCTTVHILIEWSHWHSMYTQWFTHYLIWSRSHCNSNFKLKRVLIWRNNSK